MTDRVLQIIASLRRSGVSSQLATLCTGLVERGFAVHVAALRDGPVHDDLLAAGVMVHLLPRRHRYDPLVTARLRRLAAKVRPSVVHAWDAPSTAFAHAAAVRPLVASAPAQASPHGWSRWIDNRAARSVRRYLAASPTIAEKLFADGVAQSKVTVVPRAVTVQPMGDALTKQEVFDDLGLPPQARAVAIVANLTPAKNVKELIWHADLVRVLNDDLRVVIFGDGPLRPALERFARMASDLEHVRFAGHRDDVRRLLPHLEMLWHAGAALAAPQVVLEAMAAGLPVIADQSPGAREAVVHGETGYLVPVNGRAERGRLTEELFNDGALRQSMSDSAKTRAEADFAASAAVEATIVAYESVLPEALPLTSPEA